MDQDLNDKLEKLHIPFDFIDEPPILQYNQKSGGRKYQASEKLKDENDKSFVLWNDNYVNGDKDKLIQVQKGEIKKEKLIENELQMANNYLILAIENVIMMQDLYSHFNRSQSKKSSSNVPEEPQNYNFSLALDTKKIKEEENLILNRGAHIYSMQIQLQQSQKLLIQSSSQISDILRKDRSIFYIADSLSKVFHIKFMQNFNTFLRSSDVVVEKHHSLLSHLPYTILHQKDDHGYEYILSQPLGLRVSTDGSGFPISSLSEDGSFAFTRIHQRLIQTIYRFHENLVVYASSVLEQIEVKAGGETFFFSIVPLSIKNQQFNRDIPIWLPKVVQSSMFSQSHPLDELKEMLEFHKIQIEEMNLIIQKFIRVSFLTVKKCVSSKFYRITILTPYGLPASIYGDIRSIRASDSHRNPIIGVIANDPESRKKKLLNWIHEIYFNLFKEAMNVIVRRFGFQMKENLQWPRFAIFVPLEENQKERRKVVFDYIKNCDVIEVTDKIVPIEKTAKNDTIEFKPPNIKAQYLFNTLPGISFEQKVNFALFT